MQPRLLAGVDPAGLLFEPFTDRPLGCGNHYERGCLPTGRFYEYIRGMMPENGDAYIRRLAILTYLCPLMTELREVFLARRREENGAVPRQNAGQALVAYINSNLAGDLSLDALSDRFYLSKSQLGPPVQAGDGVFHLGVCAHQAAAERPAADPGRGAGGRGLSEQRLPGLFRLFPGV